MKTINTNINTSTSTLLGMAGVLALAVMAASPAVEAGDATRVWGAGSGIKRQMTDSAAFHLLSGQVAGQAASARWGGVATSIVNNSCGVCVTNTNNGNNNRISGNEIRGTNRGSVTANGVFDIGLQN